MGRNDPALKQYMRSLTRELPCSGKMKKQLASQIRCSIMDYLQENPEADISAIQAHFGTGQEIAASFVDYEDSSVLLKKMGIKKKMLAIVAGAMALVVLSWGAAVAWEIVESKQTRNGYIEVVVEQY